MAHGRPKRLANRARGQPFTIPASNLGERHERAAKTCRGALNGAIPSIVAREAFVAACLKAGMPFVLAPGKRKPTAHPALPERFAAN
ncbi:DUF982 domain-containing protein [Rhizobium leguminosarum]|uniref:DUF982 domain-containing protein n=1 Tax=Rhizobium leguminosarum TaxID=384 RepID=A0A444HQN6_RHILE|nr:DUF982 domain-containing protein [Rhizobium leguminosarum]